MRATESAGLMTFAANSISTTATAGNVGQGSRFGEDALLIGLVGGVTSLAQNFLRALMRAILPISRLRSGRDPNGTGNPKTQAPKRSLGHPSWKEKKGEVPPLRNPTISREVRWEEKIGLLRSG